MSMTETELIIARTNFETALLFNPYDLASPNCLVRGADELYVNPYIEAAWRGYLVGIRHNESIVDRCSPLRYISPGMRTQYRELQSTEWEMDAVTDDEIDGDIRSALTVCIGTPA